MSQSTLKGVGLLAQYQDLMTSSTGNGGMQLGAKATTGDGREFRFVLAGGTTLVPGKLQQTSAEVTGWETLAVAAAAVGATTVVTTSTVTVTANELAGGYLVVAVTPGQGYTYRIAGNTAATAAVTTITLDDPIQVALTTSSTVSVVLNPFNGVILNPTTATGAIAGVAVFPIVNAQYGWIQTKGPVGVLAGGTIVVGEQVGASTVTAGAIEATTGVVADVGVAIQGIVSGDYGPVNLSIS